MSQVVLESAQDDVAAAALVEPQPGDLVAMESGAAYAAPRPDPVYHTVILLICLAVMGLAAILTVRNQAQVLIPFTEIPLPELCLTRRYWNFGCPGCGMTRCFISLVHGDIASAWSYNPAGLLLFVILAFQIPYRGLQLWRIRCGKPELSWYWVPQIALGTLAVLMLGQWALKLAGWQW